jgi:ribosomal protein L25 (general stress protein Ctc)
MSFAYLDSKKCGKTPMNLYGKRKEQRNIKISSRGLAYDYRLAGVRGQ